MFWGESTTLLYRIFGISLTEFQDYHNFPNGNMKQKHISDDWRISCFAGCIYIWIIRIRIRVQDV